MVTPWRGGANTLGLVADGSALAGIYWPPTVIWDADKALFATIPWSDQNRAKLSTMLAALLPRLTRISSENDILASKNASVEKDSEVSHYPSHKFNHNSKVAYINEAVV